MQPVADRLGPLGGAVLDTRPWLNARPWRTQTNIPTGESERIGWNHSSKAWGGKRPIHSQAVGVTGLGVFSR